MPRTVTASDGDTLCSIAARNGFRDCQRLRQEDANNDYLNRPLREGDEVTIPDIRRRPMRRITESLHRWRRRGVPPPGIRFVHGSPGRRFDRDDALAFLNISNYVTNRAGEDGTENMPSTFGYNEHAHADPDTFKVEVVDPNAGSDTVNINLRALKPVCAADGSVERHENFADADTDADRRSITVTCEKVGRRNRVRFRSRYLRLVVDDEDSKALSGDPLRTDGTAQALLTTDLADGADGNNDKIEILDQKVEASYELQNCRAPAGQRKCTVVHQLPIGENRRRIKLCVHWYRNTIGGNPAGGASEANTRTAIRMRTLRWFRRSFAQINMAPKFVSIGDGATEVEFLDPPAPNMLTISQDHGNSTAGTTTGAASQINFRLTVSPEDERAALAEGVPAAVLRAQNVTVNLQIGWTPARVGQAISGALPDGFTAEVFENPRAFTATNGSCDVLIKRTDGRRVVIRTVPPITNDTSMTAEVVRVNIQNVQSNLPNSYIPLTPEARRVVRESPGSDDRLDFYICENFTGFWGLGLNPHADLAAHFQPRVPLRWGCFVAAEPMNNSDEFPWVYPHEAGHVIYDAIHIDSGDPQNPTALMFHDVLSQQHQVDATKRITDAPVNVAVEFWAPTPTVAWNMPSTSINAAQRFRDRSGTVTEAW